MPPTLRASVNLVNIESTVEARNALNALGIAKTNTNPNPNLNPYPCYRKSLVPSSFAPVHITAPEL